MQRLIGKLNVRANKHHPGLLKRKFVMTYSEELYFGRQ